MEYKEEFNDVLRNKIGIGMVKLYNETQSLQEVDCLDLNIVKGIDLLEALGVLTPAVRDYLQSLNGKLRDENEDMYNHKNNIENYTKELTRRIELRILTNIGKLSKTNLLDGLDAINEYGLIINEGVYSRLQNMIIDYYGED